MFDHTGEFPMRRVKPVSGFPEALFTAPPRGDDAVHPEADDGVMLVDPITRRVLRLPWMTKAAADELRGVFDRIAARGAAEGDTARTTASDLLRLIGDAAEIAESMRALAYLFVKAVNDDGRDDPLTTASYLVIDTIETMARRLDALETSAQVTYAALLETGRRR